jgi:hypothetical protein
VWRTAFVGFATISDRDASARSTSADSESPKTCTCAGVASLSGKWRRVADATPDEL